MFETPHPQARRYVAEFDLRLRGRLHVAFLLTNFAQPGQRNAKGIALQDSIHRSGPADSLCGQGGVLGVLPEWTYADSAKQLVAGDRLLLFTDGSTEAENHHAVEFGCERIAQVAGPCGSSAAETKRRVMEEVAKFCEGEFRDDVTLVVAAIR